MHIITLASFKLWTMTLAIPKNRPHVCHALEVKESSLRKLPITQMSRGRQRWQALVLISIRYLNLLAIKRQLQLLLPERVKNKGTQHTGRSAQCNNIDAPLQPFVFYL